MLYCFHSVGGAWLPCMSLQASWQPPATPVTDTGLYTGRFCEISLHVVSMTAPTREGSVNVHMNLVRLEQILTPQQLKYACQALSAVSALVQCVHHHVREMHLVASSPYCPPVPSHFLREEQVFKSGSGSQRNALISSALQDAESLSELGMASAAEAEVRHFQVLLLFDSKMHQPVSAHG